MSSRSLFNVFVCLALWLPLPLDAQTQTNGNDAAPQAENSTPGIPTFYAHARQVIIDADVWDKVLKKGDRPWIGDEPLPPLEKGAVEYLPQPVARGLTARDFQVFDNGVEQKINYFRETDFPAVDMSNQWYFWPTVEGTWGILAKGQDVGDPFATYVIGYAPPTALTGDCHTIRVTVDGREVHQDRDRYCFSSSSNDLETAEGTRLGARMRKFATSKARGNIRVSAQAFAFWSSGVLRLASETSSGWSSGVPPASDYTYTVEVHDSKAPATIQISIGFDPPQGTWYYPCQKDEAIHILGMVYKGNGELGQEFSGTLACQMVRDRYWSTADRPTAGIWAPSRFDGQITLEPGEYDLRVVVSDGSSFGGREIPLRVNPLNAQDLMISDVVVGGVLRSAAWVLREAASVSPSPVLPSPLVSKNIQFFPDSDTPTRLPKHTPLFLYFEIYKPARDQASTVYYRYKITDLKTGSPVMNRGPMSASDWLVSGNAVVPIGLKVATDDLKTGTYRLELQASDSAGRETEWRQADFTIK